MDKGRVLIKKIYYHDTDSGGVVYYANYLKYLEEARTEYMRAKGVDLKRKAEEGVLFVVRKVNVEYKQPAGYGDSLTISTKISRLKNASLEFYQEVKKEDKLLVKAITNMVCINKNFQPQPIPEDILSSLKNACL